MEKEAHTAGLVAIEFEARLALGEVERKAGQATKARATLNALAQEAKAKGFNLIAAKAGGAAKYAGRRRNVRQLLGYLWWAYHRR